MQRQIEKYAPDFASTITARRVLTPPELERRNESLVGGAINGGTAELHQQLVFRPVPGLGRAETPIRGLFLASSSAHPGGGVHGAAGGNAARAAIAAHRLGRLRTMTSTVSRTMTGSPPTCGPCWPTAGSTGCGWSAPHGSGRSTRAGQRPESRIHHSVGSWPFVIDDTTHVVSQ